MAAKSLFLRGGCAANNGGPLARDSDQKAFPHTSLLLYAGNKNGSFPRLGRLEWKLRPFAGAAGGQRLEKQAWDWFVCRYESNSYQTAQ